MTRLKKFAMFGIFFTSFGLAGLRAQQPDAPPPAAPQTTPADPASGSAPQASPPATAPQQGQAPQAENNGNGTFTLHVTTRLVVLDMVVLDAKGNVVRGLKRDDFHVEEMNEPQTIRDFEETGVNTPDAQLKIESTADLDRLAPRAPVNIVLLDEFNTRFEDMAFARYSLKKFLEKQPGTLVTPTMLLAVDLQHFTVLSDYTQDKNKLISALDHHFAVNPWQLHQGAWVGERYATAFITLRRVAEAVMGHRGHKSMIWIGRGFPAFNAFNMPVDAETRVNNAVQDCVNKLRDARITLYTIDPAGVMMNPSAYGGNSPLGIDPDPFGGNYEFNKLATATGGRTLYGRNDVDAEIGTAIQDGSNFYTLTYRPTNNSPDRRKFRRIKVTVDQPGLKVVTREGYYLNYGPGKVDPQNPSRRLLTDLAAADSSNMVYDGVPLTLEPSATEPGTFTLHVSPKGLVWTPATDGEPRHADLVLMVSTFDAKGKELSRDAKVIKVNAPATVAPTGRLERGIDLIHKVNANPKAVRARFTVRVTNSGRIGTADADLKQQVSKN